MRKSYYKPYRGRRAQFRGRVLNLLLAVAIVAALLWVLCLIFFPADRIETPPAPPSSTTTAEKPSSEKPSVAETTEEEETRAPVVAEPEPEPEPETEPEQTPAAAPEPEKPAPAPEVKPAPEPTAPAVPNKRRVMVSPETLAGKAARLVTMYRAGSLTGIVVTLKDAEGTLHYPSSVNPSFVEAPAGFSEAVQTLKAAGVPLAAVMYCHWDNRYPRLETSTVLLNVENSAWRSPDGKRFLAPGNAAATAYLTSIGTELVRMGFDEIILRGLGYPEKGLTERIQYASDRYAATTEIVTAMKTAASPATVSVWFGTSGIAKNSTTGQSLEQLYNAADRVYTSANYDALRSVTGVSSGSTERVVRVTKHADLAEWMLQLEVPIP